MPTADADIPNKAQQEAPQGKKENMADARAPGHLASVEGKSVSLRLPTSQSSSCPCILIYVDRQHSRRHREPRGRAQPRQGWRGGEYSSEGDSGGAAGERGEGCAEFCA
jgi:hypothetical protein